MSRAGCHYQLDMTFLLSNLIAYKIFSAGLLKNLFNSVPLKSIYHKKVNKGRENGKLIETMGAQAEFTVQIVIWHKKTYYYKKGKAYGIRVK